jgi:hypothetical protein
MSLRLRAAWVYVWEGGLGRGGGIGRKKKESSTHLDVTFLNRPPLLLTSIHPRTNCNLPDEYFASLAKEERAFAGYH